LGSPSIRPPPKRKGGSKEFTYILSVEVGARSHCQNQLASIVPVIRCATSSTAPVLFFLSFFLKDGAYRHLRHVIGQVDRLSVRVRLFCHGFYLSRQRESGGNRLEDLGNLGLSGGVGAGAPRVSVQAPVPREGRASREPPTS